MSAKKESFTKHTVLSVEKHGPGVKFFHNYFFRTHLQQYLSSTYSLQCHIRLTEAQEIDIEMIGTKEAISSARDIIKNLFASVREKIFNQEDTDRKMIYWSQHIVSDSIIPIIQEIMDKEQLVTVWEKTAMFSGFLKTVFFTTEPFVTSIDKITKTLTREIDYISDLLMPNERTKNFLKTIDQFILARQHPELAIIQCRYPFKTDIKISLFGRQKLLKKSKKQLQSIVAKHTIQMYQLKLSCSQQDYLLDNCLEQIQDIEHEYKDDGIQIRVRQKEFSSPQYLADKVRQKLEQLVFYSDVCRFRKIHDAIILSDDQRKQIYQIARRNYCRIEKIDFENDWIVCSIPKAVTSSINAISSLAVQRSNELCSSLSMKKISVSQSCIEIYFTNDTTSISRDVTIISSPAGAHEEHIEYMGDNGYFEIKPNKKYLFYRWSPLLLDDDKHNKKFKDAGEKFVSSSLRNVVNCFPNVEKIAFSTIEWENINIEQQKQLVENLINEIRREIELRKAKWRILFLFNHQQRNLYTEFYRVLTTLQTNQDGFGQTSWPITTILITLTTSSSIDLRRGKCDIDNYVQNHILIDKSLCLDFDLRQWDQHMVNSYYHYCFTKSVWPQMNFITNIQLQLIGSVSDVEKAVSKCTLMHEILREKSSTSIGALTQSRNPLVGSNNKSQLISTGFNIYFSYCHADESICNRLSGHLINEGYVVCRKSSKKSFSTSEMNGSDVMLAAFSEKYSKDSNCIAELNHAKSMGKCVIPFLIREDTHAHSWLSSITIAELFYDLFDREIELEFDDDFDLEYDQLLSTLLQYTKPGVVGQPYPRLRATGTSRTVNTDHQQTIFGNKSTAMEKLTPKQIQERQSLYQQETKKQIEMNRIPVDEIDNLVASLTQAVDDLEIVNMGGDPYKDLNEDQEEGYSANSRHWEFGDNRQGTLSEFIKCIKRWLHKAPNVTKEHVKPFTPTGDLNDALFTIYQSSDDPIDAPAYQLFDCSTPSKYFSTLDTDSGSFFDEEQAHDYFARLIRQTKPVNDMETKLKPNEVAWQRKSPDQAEDQFIIGDELKSPEEMRKLQELDNPNRVWITKNPAVEKFIQQKINNILEFQDLCKKFP